MYNFTINSTFSKQSAFDYIKLSLEWGDLVVEIISAWTDKVNLHGFYGIETILYRLISQY